jgi:hypothetical protein
MSRCYTSKKDATCLITASGDTVCGYGQGDGTHIILGLAKPEPPLRNNPKEMSVRGQQTEHFIDLMGMINKTFNKETFVNEEEHVESYYASMGVYGSAK